MKMKANDAWTAALSRWKGMLAFSTNSFVCLVWHISRVFYLDTLAALDRHLCLYSLTALSSLCNKHTLTIILLMWRKGWAYIIPIYIRQDETLHSLFISENCLRFERPVGGVCHPQHAQTGFNSSTIAADSSNGVTNTRCCRYSCMRSWWWVEIPPETCRAVSRYK
jgi:hypothetical protein